MSLRLTFAIVFAFLVVPSAEGQAKPITAGDYVVATTQPVFKTHSAYPIILKVETEGFLNGKSMGKRTETYEEESDLHFRSTMQFIKGGKTTEVFEILIGMGNGFCKKGNRPWRKSQFACPGPGGLLRIEKSRVPESVEYSVEDKKHDRLDVKVYRKYSIFSAGKFEEEIATIGSDGYFISVFTTKGSIDPKNITSTRKETWITRATIKPVIAPIK